MRPKRIVLLRHGEAEGNVDESVFERAPDHSLALTATGRAECLDAAARLAELFAGERVQAYVSPYRRTRETFEIVRPHLACVSMYEEPRLREQDWGNFQDGAHIAQQKAERDRFGHFFYRLANGESGADVYDRVSSFFETLHRDFARADYPDNALLVTHGLTMRLFVTRWFHWSVAHFEALENPPNAGAVVLLRGADGRYTLERPLRCWREFDA